MLRIVLCRLGQNGLALPWGRQPEFPMGKFLKWGHKTYQTKTKNISEIRLVCLTQVRTLRQKVLPHADNDGFARGTKRSLYLIISVALAQPILMWWLTSHVMFGRRI